MDKRITAIQQALTQIAEAQSDVGHPRPPLPEETAALTRKIKMWRAWAAVGFSLLLAVGTIAGNLWAYIQGYADEKTAEALDQKEEDELAETVSHTKDHVKEIDAELDQARQERQDLQRQIERATDLTLLQTDYFVDVVDSARRRRRLPEAPEELSDAIDEAKARQR